MSFLPFPKLGRLLGWFLAAFILFAALGRGHGSGSHGSGQVLFFVFVS